MYYLSAVVNGGAVVGTEIRLALTDGTYLFSLVVCSFLCLCEYFLVIDPRLKKNQIFTDPFSISPRFTVFPKNLILFESRVNY